MHARLAFHAGARGYVSKAELGETLLIAIRCALGEETFGRPPLRERLEPQ